MSIAIANMPATSRVWLYMADRPLSNEEVSSLQTAGNEFVAQWAAHGKALKAECAIRYNRFLIFVVDESQAGASGCSIDSSVHFVKSVGEQLQVDFFNRLLLAYKDTNGEVQTIHSAKTKGLIAEGTINADTIVFNNMVQQFGDLQNNWEVSLKDSFYKKFL